MFYFFHSIFLRRSLIINHHRRVAFPRNDCALRGRMPIVKQCAITMDARAVRPWAAVVRSAVVDGDRETHDEFARRHHRKQIAKLTYAGNRHRRTVHMTSLQRAGVFVKNFSIE